MLVKNTVSGVVEDLPPEQTIGHAWFGRFYVPADKPKNEVLAKPYEVTPDGDRVKLEDKVVEVAKGGQK